MTSKMFMGRFDIHVDSDHRWKGERAIKIDAYLIFLREDGTLETDIQEGPIASLRIPANDVEVDVWLDSTDTKNIEKLRPYVVRAYYSVVESAKTVQRLLPLDIQ